MPWPVYKHSPQPAEDQLTHELSDIQKLTNDSQLESVIGIGSHSPAPIDISPAIDYSKLVQPIGVQPIGVQQFKMLTDDIHAVIDNPLTNLLVVQQPEPQSEIHIIQNITKHN